MPVFTYAARTSNGDIKRDEINLGSREEVMSHLRRQRLVPVNVREKPKQISITFMERVGMRDLVIMTRQFATMINAGLPLVRTLDILAQQTPNKLLARSIEEVKIDIESGNPLAEALKQHPKVFSTLYVSLVAAGEAGGILDTVLGRLAEFMEKNEALVRKVKGAMIYPFVVLGVAVIAILVLLIFVIPTFETMFASFDAVLPLPTRFVIAMSKGVQSYGFYGLGGAAVLGFLFKRWIDTPNGRLRFDAFLLRVPVIGNLTRKTAVARFTRTLGTMISSGVTILDGLEITAKTAGNRVVHDAVLQSRRAIAEGKSISEPMKRTGVFPPMVTQMINVGEETGDLDGMLSKIADFYDDEVDVAVEALLKALEPAMIVVLGTVIGGMIVAMYLPIFSLVSSIQ